MDTNPYFRDGMTTSVDAYDVHYYLDIDKQCQLVISILIYGLKLRLKRNFVLSKYLISNSVLKANSA